LMEHRVADLRKLKTSMSVCRLFPETSEQKEAAAYFHEFYQGLGKFLKDIDGRDGE
jgi:hypothetical protein